MKEYGFFVRLIDNPALITILSKHDFDFIFYDLEHGMFSLNELRTNALLAKASNIKIFARIPELTREHVSKVWDTGVDGLMAPMIETKEQAEMLVHYSKYPPVGQRSYSGGANTNYAVSGNHQKNITTLNVSGEVIVQIETIKGVVNVEEILSVEGVDGVIIGPVDLSLSLNLPDQIFDEKVLESIQKVQSVAKKHHKKFGIISNRKMHEKFNDYMQWYIAGNDIQLLHSGLDSLNKFYREMDGEKHD